VEVKGRLERERPCREGVEVPDHVDPYDGVGIISDPIHGYVRYTKAFPGPGNEATEESLIGDPWVQRLRYIHQLQSAFWVYPSAEHSRFQHSLGAMHVAGRFAGHLYPGLRRHHPDCPSQSLVESLLRIGGLLHDVGHGPFSHLCDSEYLEPRWGINHEVVGGHLIEEILSPLITGIRRSPSGPFRDGEGLDPSWVAYLIRRPSPGEKRGQSPGWLEVLRTLFSSGIFTADNLDYVLRDSYMSGLSKDPIDLERILHYTFVTERGVTYSSYGLASLQQFIQARINLFQTIYYHRTTRAMDLSIKNVFRQTLEELLPRSPLERPEDYLELTEYSLFHTVRQWARGRNRRRKRLGEAWMGILLRRRGWVTCYERTFYLDSRDRSSPLADLFLGRDPENLRRLQSLVREKLPKEMKGISFVLDLASQDPRPDNPFDPHQSIWIFDHNRRRLEQERLAAILENVPYRIIQMRILAPSHEYDQELACATEAFLCERLPSYTTNL
jgi:HD superfamily phosphohydrolase